MFDPGDNQVKGVAAEVDGRQEAAIGEGFLLVRFQVLLSPWSDFCHMVMDSVGERTPALIFGAVVFHFRGVLYQIGEVQARS